METWTFWAAHWPSPGQAARLPFAVPFKRTHLGQQGDDGDQLGQSSHQADVARLQACMHRLRLGLHDGLAYRMGRLA